MKRTPLLLALTLMCTTLFAQREVYRSELYLGFGGGAMMSSVDFVPTLPQITTTGLLAGVSARLISEKNLGLVAEMNFSQRGWSEEYEVETEFSYNRRLNYLELPFMTHIYFGNKVRFIINAGPQISFLLNEEDEMSQALADDLEARREANPDTPVGVQYASMDKMSRVDYGLVGGMGMALKSTIGDFVLEGRYYYGLGDLFTSRRSEDAFFSRSAHRLVETKLTYYIKIR